MSRPKRRLRGGGWGGRKKSKHNKDGEYFLYKLQKVEEALLDIQKEFLLRMARSEQHYIDISIIGFTNLFRQCARIYITVKEIYKLFEVAARSKEQDE